MINRFIPERTPEELEDRLKLLKQNSRYKTRQLLLVGSFNLPKAVIISGCAVLLVGLGGGLITWKFHAHPSGPFTASVEQAAGFPLLAPRTLPEGVFYDQNPAKANQGVVSFSLKNIHGTITVTEQSAPPNLPNFTGMGLKNYQVPAGTAYTGSSNNRPITIITSNTTLVSITANSSVPGDVIARIVKSLASIPE
jgi:hypothetical protein